MRRWLFNLAVAASTILAAATAALLAQRVLRPAAASWSTAAAEYHVGSASGTLSACRDTNRTFHFRGPATFAAPRWGDPPSPLPTVPRLGPATRRNWGARCGAVGRGGLAYHRAAEPGTAAVTIVTEEILVPLWMPLAAAAALPAVWVAGRARRRPGGFPVGTGGDRAAGAGRT
ncbi:MAG: hypothetical protein JWO31_1554 [Phycisphaerales bacterium]|nr:hypothetical protein [Phycisphaerales bacterium]